MFVKFNFIVLEESECSNNTIIISIMQGVYSLN